MSSASQAALVTRAHALIARLADGTRDDPARDELLRDVLRFQAAAIPAYGRLVQGFGAKARDPLAWPGMPSDAFRFARLAVHDEGADARVFRTSGTSGQARGSHHLRELGLYDRAAEAAARYALFPDRARMTLVVLAPTMEELVDSSLSYMLARFSAWFGAGESAYVLRANTLDAAALVRALDAATERCEAIALLGTSFAFVHAEDALGAREFRLPAGSRIMQTGGFKGRAREIEPDAMLHMLARRYGVGAAWIVQEYGMTELSSQLYERALRDAWLGVASEPRRLWVPGWVRATPVDAETLEPVPEGEIGLLRLDDLANIDTPCAIQTADRAVRVGDGIVLLGRAASATPRGCSLALDAALGG